MLGDLHQPVSQPGIQHCRQGVLAGLPWMLQNVSAKSVANWQLLSPAGGFQGYLTSSHGRDAKPLTFQNQLSFDGVEGHHDDDCGACNGRQK